VLFLLFFVHKYHYLMPSNTPILSQKPISQ
jgi:hypothetical protein